MALNVNQMTLLWEHLTGPFVLPLEVNPSVLREKNAVPWGIVRSLVTPY